jgi:hypothetical protein
MIRPLISLIIAVPLAIFGLPWCATVMMDLIATRILHAADPYPEHPGAAVVGLIIGVALIAWKRPNWFIHTSIHEFCHLLACLALLVRPRSFATSDGDGGAVTYERCDALRDTIIAMAPYSLPLILGSALLVRRFIPDQGIWPAVATAFASFAYLQHLQALYHNVRLNFWGNETDLARVGRPLALVLITGGVMLVTGWTIHELWTEPRFFLQR